VKYRYNPATFSYEATGDTTFNNLFRRPAHTFNLTAGVQVLKSLYVSARTRVAGRRWEPAFMGNSTELKSYYTIDFYTEYQLHPQIKIFADLKNITDQQFFDVRGYNARPFNFMAGLNINL
jgi:vitamin B12 transporter